MPQTEDVDWEEATPLVLSTMARTCTALLGVGLTGAGAVAVFETTNQAGTAALLVLGGFLLLLALIGRFPERGALGTANWEYRPLRRLLNSDNPEVREAVADEVLSSPSTKRVDPALQARAETVVAEVSTLAAVEGYLAMIHPELTVEPQPVIKLAHPTSTSAGMRYVPDMVVRPRGEEPAWRIPVEVKNRFSAQAVHQAIDYAIACHSRVAILVHTRGTVVAAKGPVADIQMNGVTVIAVRLGLVPDTTSLGTALDRAIHIAQS